MIHPFQQLFNEFALYLVISLNFCFSYKFLENLNLKEQENPTVQTDNRTENICLKYFPDDPNFSKWTFVM